MFTLDVGTLAGPGIQNAGPAPARSVPAEESSAFGALVDQASGGEPPPVEDPDQGLDTLSLEAAWMVAVLCTPVVVHDPTDDAAAPDADPGSDHDGIGITASAAPAIDTVADGWSPVGDPPTDGLPAAAETGRFEAERTGGTGRQEQDELEAAPVRSRRDTSPVPTGRAAGPVGRSPEELVFPAVASGPAGLAGRETPPEAPPEPPAAADPVILPDPRTEVRAPAGLRHGLDKPVDSAAPSEGMVDPAAVIAAAGRAAGGADQAGTHLREQEPASTLPARPPAPAIAPGFSAALAEVQRAASAPAHQVASAAPHPDAPEPATVHELVQTMRLQFRGGIGDAVVRLRPEHLGEVTVSLRVEQHSVSATLRAELASVRGWLEAHEWQLRNGLSEQGLTLDEFAVREDETGRRNRGHGEGGGRQSTRRRGEQTSEPGPRFEVVV